MANDSMRLTTAELRRRLTAPSAPLAEAIPAPAPAAAVPMARRLVAPTRAEFSLDEEDGSFLIDRPDEPDSTDLPANHSTPTDLRRPAERSSFRLPRPVVPQAPAPDSRV